MASRGLAALLAGLTATTAIAQIIPTAFPEAYVSYALAANETIYLDGRLDEPAWTSVAWSNDFGDIQGPSQPAPYYQTRVKMRWDSTYLFVGALLQETQVWANQTQDNSVVFHDNDFEVFVDADGSTHWYKELEVNAINTTWHLTLPQPYINGGVPFNNTLPGFRSAVYVNGPVNDPSAGPDTYWSVELALPLAAYVVNTTARAPPHPGDQWRINFSRVEWNVTVVDGRYVKTGAPCHNWVWSPQWAIAMHLPERWGYVQFADNRINATAFQPDPTWPLRLVLRTVYYSTQMFAAVTEYAPSALSDLTTLPSWVLDGSLGTATPDLYYDAASGQNVISVAFTAGHGGSAAGTVGYMRADRLTWMVPA